MQSLVFDAERDSADVFAALSRAHPTVPETMARIRKGWPSGVHCGERQAADWFRLPGHYRSFCIPSDQAGAWYSSAVVSVKGSEPTFADFPEYLQWMMTAQFRNSQLPLALHLALNTRTPPGAMPLDEAQREQAISTEVQQQHLAAFGALAQVPTPLLVFRLDDEVAGRYTARLAQALPAHALERIEGRARAGLGIIVSCYPAPPIRLDDVSRTGTSALGLHAGQMLLDPDTVVERWARLLARLLGLGYMPLVPWNAGWGCCLDAGNACIDGGFADLVTLTRSGHIADARVFRASLMLSLESFAWTVAALARRSTGMFASHGDGPYAERYALSYVTPLVQEMIQRETAGLTVDPRLHASVRMTSVHDLAVAMEAISHSTRRFTGGSP